MKMMKKYLSLLIVVVSLVGLSAAGADSRTIPGSVKNRSATFRNNVFERWIEFSSTNPNLDVDMLEGDYVVLTPIHRVLTEYLSYSISDVSVSDPTVVSATTSTGSNGDLSLRLHALKEGNAAVNVNFSTYHTRTGLEYEDRRGDPSASYTVNVHVEGVGGVEMKLSIDGGGSSVKGFTISMLRLFDTMSPEQQAEITRDITNTVRNLGLNIGGTVAYETSAAGVLHLMTLVDKVMLKAARVMVKIQMYTFGIFQMVTGCIVAARDIRTHYYAGKYKTMMVPTVAPKNLSVKVTINNTTGHTVKTGPIELTADDHLSFSAITGPWGTTKIVSSGLTIGPNSSEVLYVPIHPRFVKDVLSQMGEKVLAYTASLTARSDYVITDTGRSGDLSGEVSIPTYTAITQEKIDQFKKTLVQEYNSEKQNPLFSNLVGGAFNGYQRWYGFSRFDQLFVIACPVEVIVSDASGAELAVIGQESDVYVNDGITAFCIDETKFVDISPNYIGEYAISARANGTGSMSVLTYKYDADTGVSVSQYDEVPLNGEDVFSFNASTDGTACLNLLDASGAATALTADLTITQSDLVSEMADLGFSEVEAEAAADLLVRGLISESFVEDVHSDMDLEAFSGLMSGIAMHVYDFRTDEAVEDNVALAQVLGLLTRAEAEGMSGRTLQISDALILTDRVMEALDFANNATQLEWAQVDPDDEVVAPTGIRAGLGYTYGLSVGMELSDGLTPGRAALIARRLLDVVDAARERDILVERITAAYENSLNWTDTSSYGFVFGKEPDGAHAVYGNYGLWIPGEFPKYVLYQNSNAYILPKFNSFAGSVEGRDIMEEIEKLGYTAMTSDALGGVSCNNEGMIFKYTPVVFLDRDNQLYMDSVYLLIVRLKAGTGENYFKWHSNAYRYMGEAEAEYFFVEDQDIVAAYLETVQDVPQRIEIAESDYQTLSVGSKGDAVKTLQEALIRKGCLTGSADGSYGPKTAEAVKAFQQAQGMEPTGAADPATQVSLFADDIVKQACVEWCGQRFSQPVYKAAMDALAMREANNRNTSLGSVTG